jgi:hypothetical protein
MSKALRAAIKDILAYEGEEKEQKMYSKTANDVLDLIKRLADPDDMMDMPYFLESEIGTAAYRVAQLIAWRDDAPPEGWERKAEAQINALYALPVDTREFSMFNDIEHCFDAHKEAQALMRNVSAHAPWDWREFDAQLAADDAMRSAPYVSPFAGAEMPNN